MLCSVAICVIRSAKYLSYQSTDFKLRIKILSGIPQLNFEARLTLYALCQIIIVNMVALPSWAAYYPRTFPLMFRQFNSQNNMFTHCFNANEFEETQRGLLSRLVDFWLSFGLYMVFKFGYEPKFTSNLWVLIRFLVGAI